MNYECEYKIGQKLYTIRDKVVCTEEVTSVEFLAHTVNIGLYSPTVTVHVEPIDYVRSHYFGKEKLFEELVGFWEDVVGITLTSECKKQIQNAIEWELTSL